jgi:protein TonB
MNATALNHNAVIGVDAWGLADETDRRFRKTAAITLLVFVVLAIVIPLLKLAGLERGGGDTLDRRYVSLLPDAEIADKTEEPKPSDDNSQKAEEPKPQESPKPEPAKPKAEKAPPTPKPVEPTHEQQVEAARDKAAQSGVMAMADQLKALRDNSLQGIDTPRPLTSDMVTAKAGTGASGGSAAGGASIAQSAAASSGGISGSGTGDTRRSQSGAGLGQRRTTVVESPIGMGPDKTHPGQSGDKQIAARTLDEIQLTFDRSKAAFYSIYQRELRDKPDVRGKIVISLTIAPNGSVTAAQLVSSELGDPELEDKILQRVKLLNFGAKNVPSFTYPNYPIVLFPA